MLRINSLLWRIVTLHGLAIAAVSILLPAIVAERLHATAERYEHRLLNDRLAVIVRTLGVTPSGGVALPYRVADAVSGDGSFGLLVADRQGRRLAASGAAPARLFRAEVADRTYFHTQLGGVSYVGVEAPVRVAGRPLLIEVVQNMDAPDVVIDDVEDVFLSHLAWLIVPVLLALFALDLIVVRTVLTPVLRASLEAREIDAARLDVRIHERGLPDEVRPLVRAVNQALVRLQRAFQAQRDFTADVAHELRTPLAVLRLRVEAMSDRKTSEALLSDIEMMSRVVEQLLALAELESAPPHAPVTTDLGAAAERVVRHLAPAAIANRKALALIPSEGPNLVCAEPGAVFQALRNLVENALAHSPEGGTVEVKLEPGGVARVLDRGPGVPAAERELIFERFWRRDRRSGSGAGLGLAIVSRIVGAYGGAVRVSEREGGGADFTLQLAPAEPA